MCNHPFILPYSQLFYLVCHTCDGVYYSPVRTQITRLLDRNLPAKKPFIHTTNSTLQIYNMSK